MSKKKVLLILPMYHKIGEEILSQEVDIIETSDYSEENLLNLVQNVDAIILRAPAKLSRRVIEKCTDVKVISQGAVGIDNIDVEAATKENIPVLHAPNYTNTTSVAEHTIALMIALSKKLIYTDQKTRQGLFNIRNSIRTVELENKILGLIGFGAIGQGVAQKCRLAFNMKIMAYDPYIKKDKFEEMGVKYAYTIDEILSHADFVSIHVSLSKETKGLLDFDQFIKMKHSAFLINVSRGAVINEKALVNALKEKIISGAAIDVFESEPPPQNHPFFEFENIIVTPHIGGLTEEAAMRMATVVAENVLKVLRGEKPDNIVNPEIYND